MVFPFRVFKYLTVISGLVIAGSFALPSVAIGQSQQEHRDGIVRGLVALEGQGPVAGALVLIVDIGLSTRTDHEGRFEIADVPPGVHQMLAQRQGMGSARRQVTVVEDEILEIEFSLQLQARNEAITVTASATGETTAFDTFNAVSSLDSVSLAKDMSGTLGEVLENEPGLAKRGYGPASSRPIIRGFDGDRVLILENGIRTGDLSSQSGDHGTTIDPGNVDRVEVVRGPATLLYGSNAIGGVVNAISPDETFRTTPHEGLQVNGTADGGTANAQLGGNANFTYAEGEWMIYGGAGSRRTGDYDTPIGTVENTSSELSNGRLGFGYFGDTGFFGVGYRVEDGNYGVPLVGDALLFGGGGDDGEDEEPAINLDSRRQSLRFDAGITDFPAEYIESFRLIVNVLDWNHRELETVGDDVTVGTIFDNRTYIARAEFEQHKYGAWHGKFGAWYQNRDYIAVGEEALSPPVVQHALAAFVYEELDFEGWRMQFGGRVENNDYVPEARPVVGLFCEPSVAGCDDDLVPPVVGPRSFTGASGSAGIQVDLPYSHSLVANLTSSYRAPALEDLYNFGPHVGSLTFEVGDPDLTRERANGFDVSLRRDSRAVAASVNFFYYGIRDYVFVALTERIVDGLRLGHYTQGDSRFVGIDANANVRLHRHLNVDLSFGWVDAELTASDTPLPRIPPIRVRVRIEIPYQQFRVEPEVILAAAQNNVFVGEQPTAGYTVWTVGGSYTMAVGSVAHIFSIRGYNLTNELYYNHSSFLKDLVPEMGRGVKFGYALRVF